MKRIILFIGIILVSILAVSLYYLNIIPNTYSSKYDYLNTYISSIDKDDDGINDQRDILENAKAYVARRPKYKSKYYNLRIS